MSNKIHVILNIAEMNDEKNFQYIINKDTIHLPKELENLLELKKLSDITGEDRHSLTISLKQARIEDFGDYDFDDNYIPDIREEDSFIPIQYNPITGERFEIIIEGFIYNPQEYNKIYQEFSELPCYGKRTKAQEKKYYQLSKAIESFYKDLYVSQEDYEKYLEKSSIISQCVHCLHQHVINITVDDDTHDIHEICERGRCKLCQGNEDCKDFTRVELVYLKVNLYDREGNIEPENPSNQSIKKKLYLNANNLYALMRVCDEYVEIYSGIKIIKIPKKVYIESFERV